MIKILIFLFIFALVPISKGQIVTGGSGGGGGGKVKGDGPSIGERPYYVLDCQKSIAVLIDAFQKSWEGCGKGTARFHDIVSLQQFLFFNNVFEADQSPNQLYCKCNCLYSDKVREALKSFNKEVFMTRVLIQEEGLSEAEAEQVVNFFKNYE